MEYKVTIKEYKKSEPIVTSISGRKMTNQEIIDFFGLDNNDVEWYKIEEVKNELNK